jgi:hypothetical protein
MLPVAIINTSAARITTSPISFEGDLIYFFANLWTPKAIAGTKSIKACM